MYAYLKSHFKTDKRFWFLRMIASLFVNPPKAAVVYYRLSHYFYINKRYKMAKFFFLKNVRKHSCFISEKATIGQNVHFKHPNGIVIGEDVVIGDNVTIYHQVTIGGKNKGDLDKHNYPTIEDDVVIFAGAKILGNDHIGKNVTIGANSVVVTDLEEGGVYAGIPAHKIH